MNKTYAETKIAMDADPALKEKFKKKWRKNSAQFRKNHPLAARESMRKCRYGINKEQWDAMFEAQGGVCKICGAGDPALNRGWHTDHIAGPDGKPLVRGILCGNCNVSLRWTLTPEILRKMAVYVETEGRIV